MPFKNDNAIFWSRLSLILDQIAPSSVSIQLLISFLKFLILVLVQKWGKWRLFPRRLGYSGFLC